MAEWEKAPIEKAAPSGWQSAPVTKAAPAAPAAPAKVPSLFEQLSTPLVTPRAAEVTVAGGVRGFRDIAQGIMQLGIQSAEKMGLVSPEVLASLEQYVHGSMDAFDEKYGNDPAAAGGRVAGQITATAPVQALRVGGRLVTNALQGGTIGALQPTRGDKPWVERGINTATSTAAGVVIPEVVRGGLNLGGRVAGKFAGKPPTPAGTMTPGDVTTEGPTLNTMRPVDISDRAKEALRAGGIEFDNLSDQMKAQVMDWTMRNASRLNLTPQEVVNLQTFRTLPAPAEPTKAMVTQNFDDFVTEDLLGSGAGGEPIRRAHAAVNDAVRKSVQSMKAVAGEGSEAGKTVANVLEGYQAQIDGTIDRAYAAARAAAGDTPAVNMLPITREIQAMKRAASASQDGLAFWRAVNGYLKDVNLIDAKTGAVRKLSIAEAETARQWLNSLPYNPSTYRFVAQLKNSIDDAVLETGKGGLFDDARFLRRLKGAIFEDQAIVGKLLEKKGGSSVDRTVPISEMFDTAVVKSTPEEFKQIVNTIRTSNQSGAAPAIDDLRNATLEWIERAARSAEKGEGNTVIYNAKSFENALKKLGRDKLETLFGNEVSTLYQISDALRLAKPIRGTTNPSGSGNRVIEFFRRFAPRVLGGAVGAATGGPMGAAAGAGVGDAVAQGAADAARGARASKLAGDAAGEITRGRMPSFRLGDLLPLPGYAAANAPAQFVRDLGIPRSEYVTE